MQYQSTVFGQLLKALPRGRFERLAKGHAMGRKKRELSSWGHLVAMIFAQAGGARSLRDLERLFERHHGVAAHLGLGQVKRSTLADANRSRSADLFCDVAMLLAGDLGRGRGARAKRCPSLMPHASSLASGWSTGQQVAVSSCM
jgi:hypothetical protein